MRLDLFEGYDAVINESITPPPQRTGLDSDAQLVSQSNRLLQQVTLLSTQSQVPVELYDAEGQFLARYRPDLDGFVRQLSVNIRTLYPGTTSCIAGVKNCRAMP